MNTSVAHQPPKPEALAVDVQFSDDALKITLVDGRELAVPLDWSPRLLQASSEQRQNWRLIGGGIGIHWEDIDEDLSVENLFRLF